MSSSYYNRDSREDERNKDKERNYRDTRNYRDNRDSRDSRDSRDYRDTRYRDNYDNRDKRKKSYSRSRSPSRSKSYSRSRSRSYSNYSSRSRSKTPPTKFSNITPPKSPELLINPTNLATEFVTYNSYKASLPTPAEIAKKDESSDDETAVFAPRIIKQDIKPVSTSLPKMIVNPIKASILDTPVENIPIPIQTIIPPIATKAILSKVTPIIPAKQEVIPSPAAPKKLGEHSTAAEILEYLKNQDPSITDATISASTLSTSSISSLPSTSLAAMSALAADAAAKSNFASRKKKTMTKEQMFEATKTYADLSTNYDYSVYYPPQ